MRFRQPLLLGSALALATAAPAGAAEVAIGVDDTVASAPKWTPANVTVQPGDTVVWNLASQVQVHDVAALAAADAASWNFQVPAPGPQGRYTFTAPGRYRFLCRLHSSSDGTTGMVGTVTVGNVPPPPPPPPGQQPFPNPNGEPGMLEVGGVDEIRPKLSRVRVKRRANGARVRFRVSERARVTVRLKRRGKTVKTRRINAVGNTSLTVRGKRLRAGRYRVELRAEDVAGNESRARTASVRIR